MGFTKPMTKGEVEKLVYAVADEAEAAGYACGLEDGMAGHDS